MANDFSKVEACKTWWRFENNLNDSKGNNDLTNVNSLAFDQTIVLEGAYSILPTGTEYAKITDADMDADNPLKSTVGGTFTCLGRFVMGTAHERQILGDYNGSKYGFDVFVTGGRCRAQVGYNAGANVTTVGHSTLLSDGTKYAFGFSYAEDDKGMRLRIWNLDTGAAVGSDATVTLGASRYASDADLQICARNGSYLWRDQLDEITILNEEYTVEQMDAYFQGNVVGSAGGISPLGLNPFTFRIK